MSAPVGPGRPPRIGLLATGATDQLLANALAGLAAVGVDPADIVIGTLPAAEPMVRQVVGERPIQIRLLAPTTGVDLDDYVPYGTAGFNEVCWLKVRLIRDLLEEDEHVVYADLDVAWLRDPRPYLAEVATAFPIAIQSEAQPVFPPALCCGFMSFRRTDRSLAFVDAWLAADRPGDPARPNDQEACQALFESDPAWQADIHVLPEAAFPVGITHGILSSSADMDDLLHGRAEPFVFHANWTVGSADKRRLLERSGAWTAPDPDGPLITVVYPVFDVRGEEADRIRMWTLGQDLADDRYRVLVVAGDERPLDAASVRAVLRPQDRLLIEPGPGRDADYWNAGAAAASTPWLVFTEAHGMPPADCLSALAAWITAHPGASVANCVVENPDDHAVSHLMKQWFGEVQATWAAPDTWPRIHRAAFAMHRDVFAEVGPFDAQYGQFAPPLMSARLHTAGRPVQTVPDARILHDDARELGSHHSDTRDYVRGEMDARAVSEPSWFEGYFGPPSTEASLGALPVGAVRRAWAGLVLGSLGASANRRRTLRSALPLTSWALVGRRGRLSARLAMIAVDERLVMQEWVPEPVRWRRFRTAHRRAIAAEQLDWGMRHGAPAIPADGQRRAVGDLPPGALVGVHAMEVEGEVAFRWSEPLLLVVVEAAAGGSVLRIETGGLRGGLAPADVDVFVGSTRLPRTAVVVTADGGIDVALPARTDTDGPGVVAIVVDALRESGPAGRSLGLPVVAVTVRRA